MLPAESTVPVLFLPGTLCDARVFAAISGALSAERTLHADLTQDTSVQDAAERLLATAPDRFIAVGFSLGPSLRWNSPPVRRTGSRPWC
jgi:pimeloyl-ACP methyl ester carboxylesterase